MLFPTWVYIHQACMHLVNIIHTSDMHASCEHHTHIKHACIFWTSYTHQACMHLVNIAHTAGMHAPCEHRTHIKHAWIFWTSNTHQACIHLENVVHKSEMHASCEHHTHIKHASSEHHTHTSDMHGPVYTTWCFLWTTYTHQVWAAVPEIPESRFIVNAFKWRFLPVWASYNRWFRGSDERLRIDDIFCEQRTHINHECILWTSYTHHCDGDIRHARMIRWRILWTSEYSCLGKFAQLI